MSIQLTDALRAEYDHLFDTMEIRDNFRGTAQILARSLLANQAVYEGVGAALGIPWQFVGVIHNMEASQSFRRHLHNGDPLTDRTVHVPAGRPVSGEPPFTWETSAIDALSMHPIGPDWTVAGMLYQIERYNGWGYRLFHNEVLTPYLWSWSTHYGAGKFVADGQFDSAAVSQQCGAAVLLRILADAGQWNAAPATLAPGWTPPIPANSPTAQAPAEVELSDADRLMQAELDRHHAST